MSPGCERAMAIALAEAEGTLVSVSELARRQQHLASCGACRREAAALALLRLPEGGPPHFPAPRAERERLLDEVLARVDLPDDDGAEAEADVAEPLPAPAPVVSLAARRRPLRWAAGLAAAAALAVAAVRLAGPGAPPPPSPRARVLLASGPGPSAGRSLEVGERFAAGDSAASVAVGADIVLLLEPGASARLERLDARGAQVALEGGGLHASVRPQTPGPRLAVSTAAGRVEVTGTLFSVEAGEGGSELRVLRGSVRASAPGRAASRVGALQALRLGAGKLRPMSAEEQEAGLAAQRRIGLLEPGEAAVLQVRSRPQGAPVLLDGEPLGKTPLSAEVKAGRRHLQVGAGEGMADEWLDLHAGAVALRDLDLTPATPMASARPAGARAAVARESAEELLRRAQALRTRREWTACAAAYRELLAHYPGAALSEAAYVSLGEILVDHLGDPRGALKACEASLERFPGGAVAAEAAHCRIRALRALGRRAEERRAVREFLERFPGSPQAADLARR